MKNFAVIFGCLAGNSCSMEMSIEWTRINDNKSIETNLLGFKISSFFCFFLFPAIVLGVNGRYTKRGPEEVSFELDDINNWTVDTIEFEKLEINWKMVMERAGDYLSLTLEALDDISSYNTNVAFKFLNENDRTLIKRVAYSNGESILEFPRFMTWAEFINPENKIVVDDKATLVIKMQMIGGCMCFGAHQH